MRGAVEGRVVTGRSRDNGLDAVGATRGPRIRFSDPEFGEILEFLWEEAALLDHDEQRQWLRLVAEDVSYRMPRRKTVSRADGPDVDLDASAPACYSDLEEMVVNNTFDGDRYERHSARTRRFVTNVQPYRTGVDNEYAVTSYILLMRSEFDDTTYDIVSAERHDVLRHSLEGLVLARRTVTFDMAILGAPFPNVIF